jgi:hypothetical protein
LPSSMGTAVVLLDRVATVVGAGLGASHRAAGL